MPVLTQISDYHKWPSDTVEIAASPIVVSPALVDRRIVLRIGRSGGYTVHTQWADGSLSEGKYFENCEGAFRLAWEYFEQRSRSILGIKGPDNSKCPICACESVTGDSADIDGKYAKQEVTCDDCRRSWTDIYTLTDQEIHSDD